MNINMNNRDNWIGKDGRRYRCEYIVKKGRKLSLSVMCGMCTEKKSCNKFINTVNLVNSPEVIQSQKFQRMINAIKKDNETRLQPTQKKNNDDLAVLDYTENLNLYLAQNKEEKEEVTPKIDTKRILAKKRLESREQKQVENTRKRFMIKQARRIFNKDEDGMKQWLAEQGITWLTQKEKDIRDRIKKRKARGIILKGEKPIRKNTRKTPEELAKYKNAKKITFDLSTPEDDDDDEELIFTIKAVDKKQEPTKDSTNLLK